MPSPAQHQSQEEGFILVAHKVGSDFSSSSRQSSICSRPPSYSEKPKFIWSNSNKNNELVAALRTLHDNAGGFAQLRDAVQSILASLDMLSVSTHSIKSQGIKYNVQPVYRTQISRMSTPFCRGLFPQQIIPAKPERLGIWASFRLCSQLCVVSITLLFQN